METRKIFDSKGVWLINKGAYPFVDPTTNCRFDPRVPTQAPRTEWVKSQPTLSVWVDPDEPAKPEPKKPESGKSETKS